MNLSVNGINQVVDGPGDTKLLWVIREHLRLTGTKFGCGLGLCGACTVHMNGEAVRSCQIEISDAEGTQITTIEARVRKQISDYVATLALQRITMQLEGKLNSSLQQQIIDRNISKLAE